MTPPLSVICSLSPFLNHLCQPLQAHPFRLPDSPKHQKSALNSSLLVLLLTSFEVPCLRHFPVLSECPSTCPIVVTLSHSWGVCGRWDTEETASRKQHMLSGGNSPTFWPTFPALLLHTEFFRDVMSLHAPAQQLLASMNGSRRCSTLIRGFIFLSMIQEYLWDEIPNTLAEQDEH